MSWQIPVGIASIVGLAVLAGCLSGPAPPPDGVDDLLPAVPEDCGTPPTYARDPNWPPLLPNGWSLGTVAGVAVGPDESVWVLHRSGVTALDGGVPSAGTGPPVIQFDPQGNVLRAWGGPGSEYDWPDTEHGIGVDAEGDVWLSGNGAQDHMLIKFSEDGEFLLQVGGRGVSQGNSDVDSLGRAADMAADDREVFVADGYGNKRVIVFDLNGTYQRHWGAYGNVPEDGVNDPDEQFRGPVHGIALAQDGTVFVGDRDIGRVHSFARDGTFLREYPVPPASLGDPTAFDVALVQPEEDFLAIADAWLATGNDRVVIVCRWTGEMAGEVYGALHPAVGGPGPPLVAGHATILHAMVGDSQGNLYLGDGYGAGTGGQVHKLVRVD